MTQNFTDVFGLDVVPPSEYGYQLVTLAADTPLNWPFNNTANVLSKIMEVSATAGSLSITMPSATEVSVGEDMLFKNIGANAFAIKDNSGTVIVSVAVGTAIYLYLTDNTTVDGEWSVINYGVGTSSVDAASLVGYGIKAIAASLNQAHPVLTTASGLTVGSTHRASLINFTGGAATLVLPAASSLGDDFFTLVRNSGTGTLVINPDQSETIDSVLQMDVQPGESLFLFCSGGAWYTVGYGRSIEYAFTQLVLDVTAGGPFTLSAAEAANKLLTFIGTPGAQVNVIVPNVVAVYYVLNSCSTAQNVAVKTSAGTSTIVPQTQRIITICDGTNVYSAQSVSASSTVSLLDGSVALPSLNFASQTNTGLYKYSTNGLGLAVAGADLQHLESTGTTFGGTSPIVSAKIGPSVGQQHTVPAVASDTLALLAATQTLTNKTIVAASNTISTAASGGLIATELNAALAELEAEIVLKSTTTTTVEKTSSTGSAIIPVGTTGQRDGSPVKGYMRYNDTDDLFEGYFEGTGWTQVGGITQAAGDARYVNLSGDAMTGDLTVPKQQLGLSGTAAENHFWDGSTANQLSLKRGTPGAPGTEVLKVSGGGVAMKGNLATPTAGQIGEVIYVTNNPLSVSTGSFNGVGFVTLTQGVWLLTGALTYEITTGPNQMRSAGFSTDNSSFTAFSVLEQYSSNGGFGGSVALCPEVVVVGAGGLLIYVTGRSSFTGGSITMGCAAAATRIA